MSAEILNYQTAEGLDDQQMAGLLSDRLGRTISSQGYRIVKSRRDAPLEWLEALNIAPQEPPPTKLQEVYEKSEKAGTKNDPSDKPLPSALPFEVQSAKTTIELIYVGAGKGASMAMRCPPVAGVWAQMAPDIAEAYIQWARESPRVAQIIGAITLGGPAGQLVLMHGTLVVTSLIIADRFPTGTMIPPAMQSEPSDNGDTDPLTNFTEKDYEQIIDELNVENAGETAKPSRPRRPRNKTS